MIRVQEGVADSNLGENSMLHICSSCHFRQPLLLVLKCDSGKWYVGLYGFGPMLRSDPAVQ